MSGRWSISSEGGGGLNRHLLIYRGWESGPGGGDQVRTESHGEGNRKKDLRDRRFVSREGPECKYFILGDDSRYQTCEAVKHMFLHDLCPHRLVDVGAGGLWVSSSFISHDVIGCGSDCFIWTCGLHFVWLWTSDGAFLARQRAKADAEFYTAQRTAEANKVRRRHIPLQSNTDWEMSHE